MGLKELLCQNAAEWLIGAGTVSLLSAPVMAINATRKADEAWERKCFEENIDVYRTVDKLKHDAKYYVPTVVTMIVGTVCVMKGVKMECDEKAMYAGVANLAIDKMFSLRDSIDRNLTIEDAYRVKRDAAARDYESSYVNETNVTHTEYGNHLCYSAVSGRYWRSDIAHIELQLAEANNKLNSEDVLTVSEIEEMFGLKPNKACELAGVSRDRGLINFVYDTELREGYEPCIIIDYDVESIDTIIRRRR